MGPEKIRNDKVDRKWQNNAYEKGICGRRVLIEPYWNVKHGIQTSVMAVAYRINRTILECKAGLRPAAKNRKFVLIEPYWNVKQGQYQNMSQLQNRINRTILECKVPSTHTDFLFLLVLIEPYWNVKEPLKQLARKYYTVLIEPYWNVKIFPEPKKG